jgi:hypothetical protein
VSTVFTWRGVRWVRAHTRGEGYGTHRALAAAQVLGLGVVVVRELVESALHKLRIKVVDNEAINHAQSLVARAGGSEGGEQGEGGGEEEGLGHLREVGV